MPPLSPLLLLLIICWANSLRTRQNYYKGRTSARHLTERPNETEAVPKTPTEICESRIQGILKGIATLSIATPKTARAEKGAFEMDMEYYMKDLVNVVINDKSNDKVQSQLKTFNRKTKVYGPPRKIDAGFASSVIDIVQNKIEVISNVSREKLLEAVLDKIDYNVKYFKTFVPLQSNDITDQYFFDVYLYVLYTEAGKFIKSSEDRVKLRQMVGEGVLFLLYRNYNISIPKAVDSSYAAASLGTKSTILSKKVDQLGPGIRQILEAFKATGVISGFSFDEEDLVDEKYAFSSFSEGLPVSFQVTILEPATILGFLQQAMADTFYHPEIVAATIVNYASASGYRLEFEDYLLDREYRTDNFDVQAQDILLEFRLQPK